VPNALSAEAFKAATSSKVGGGCKYTLTSAAEMGGRAVPTRTYDVDAQAETARTDSDMETSGRIMLNLTI
jgi:hypothetical protein